MRLNTIEYGAGKGRPSALCWIAIGDINYFNVVHHSPEAAAPLYRRQKIPMETDGYFIETARSAAAGP
jgi:hypothetical protein